MNRSKQKGKGDIMRALVLLCFLLLLPGRAQAEEQNFTHGGAGLISAVYERQPGGLPMSGTAAA
jgi:hypothetical protein